MTGQYPRQKHWVPGLLVLLISVFLNACTGTGDEQYLIDLFTTAAQDLSSIEIPSDNEDILSVNSEYDFTVQGLRTDGATVVDVTNNLQWSLSDGAQSTIDQSGHLTAGSVAESFTVTAKLGVLTTPPFSVTISAAKFDRVEQLSEQAIDINMCQTKVFVPIGRYVNEDTSVEIRPVDNTVIDSIEWLITNQEDDADSQRAYVATSAQQTSLHSLEAGDVYIRAKAMSIYTGSEVTSAAFSQTIASGLNSVKLCLASDTDYSTCAVTSDSVEKDTVLSLIAVGNYQAGNGSDFDENISGNSKWGISNTDATIAFSSDRQQVDITGVTEGGTTNVSVACGTIDQSISGVDITQGIILDTAVSCINNPATCLDSSALITIDKLSVLSFDVTANNTNLEDNVSLALASRPAEITLAVTANYANDSQAVITDDSELVYNIITISGQADAIEAKSGAPGVFTVLGAGTAKIQLEYRSKIFLAVIQIP